MIINASRGSVLLLHDGFFSVPSSGSLFFHIKD